MVECAWILVGAGGCRSGYALTAGRGSVTHTNSVFVLRGGSSIKHGAGHLTPSLAAAEDSACCGSAHIEGRAGEKKGGEATPPPGNLAANPPPSCC